MKREFRRFSKLVAVGSGVALIIFGIALAVGNHYGTFARVMVGAEACLLGIYLIFVLGLTVQNWD